MALFEAPLAAAIITALSMVSPCLLQLNQLARPYCLWTTLTVLSSALVLLIPDLLGGAGRTTEARYMMPCLVALELAIGYVIFRLVKSTSLALSITGKALLATFLCAGLLSCCSLIRSKMWWYNFGIENLATAAIVNSSASKNPVVLGNFKRHGSLPEYYSLASVLRPDVIMAFSRNEKKLLPIPEQAKDIFLFDPSPEQLAELSASGKYSLQEYKKTTNRLWSLRRSSQQ